MKTLLARMLIRIKIHLKMGLMKKTIRVPIFLPEEGKVKFRQTKIWQQH
jgi:hypothetical protein